MPSSSNLLDKLMFDANSSKLFGMLLIGLTIKGILDSAN